MAAERATDPAGWAAETAVALERAAATLAGGAPLASAEATVAIEADFRGKRATDLLTGQIAGTTLAVDAAFPRGAADAVADGPAGAAHPLQAVESRTTVGGTGAIRTGLRAAGASDAFHVADIAARIAAEIVLVTAAARQTAFVSQAAEACADPLAGTAGGIEAGQAGAAIVVVVAKLPATALAVDAALVVLAADRAARPRAVAAEIVVDAGFAAAAADSRASAAARAAKPVDALLVRTAARAITGGWARSRGPLPFPFLPFRAGVPGADHGERRGGDDSQATPGEAGGGGAAEAIELVGVQSGPRPMGSRMGRGETWRNRAHLRRKGGECNPGAGGRAIMRGALSQRQWARRH